MYLQRTAKCLKQMNILSLTMGAIGFRISLSFAQYSIIMNNDNNKKAQVESLIHL